MNETIAAVGAWLQKYEYVAVWLEGIALVAILFLDWVTRRGEHRETIAHMDIARKQIHADRVAEIFKGSSQVRVFHRVGPD